MPGSLHPETRSHKRKYHVPSDHCRLRAGTQSVDARPCREREGQGNPAVRKLNRNIPRHKEFLKRIEQSKGVGDINFLGDSVTYGWESQKAWQEHFGSVKPVNLGIGGGQTGQVLWRITEGNELDHLKPKAAVIMIGTNNNGGHTAQQIAGCIQAIVKELKHQKPHQDRSWCWASSRAAVLPMPSEAWNR